MTIAELWQKLQDAYIRSGALSLPADNTLGSPAISALIGDAAYYPGGALVLTIEGTPQVGDTIVISGTFEQDFLGQTTPASTLIFRIDGDGVAQLDQSILLPAGWTLDATFTALKDTKAAGLSFSDAAFRLASVAHEAPEGLVLEQGLNLLGKVALKGPFAPVDWVWGAQGRSALWTGGRLRTGADPFGDVPQIALGPAIVETGLSVGATGLGAGIATSIAPDTDGKAEERFFLRGLLTVTPALNPFALSADLTEAGQGLLTLQLGSIDSPLATLDDLAALANGTPLGNLVPSQVPLGDNLRLQSVSVSLSTISKKVVGAGVTVGLEGVDWTLLPNDVLTLQALRLTVTLSPTWKPSFVTSGAFGIGQDATIGMSVVIPKMTVTGALETGDTIPLAELVAQFFGGGVPDLGHPLVVNDLHFAMTPSDQTYRFRAGFETNDWVFGLGPDLPVPEITLEGFALAVARSQTVTSFDLTADLEFLNNPWTVSASLPDTKGGWTLSARLDAGTITVKDVIDGLLPKSWGVQFPDNANLPKITSLSVSFMTANRTFAVAGALDWEIEIIADELVFDIEATVRLQSARTDKTLPAQYSGEVGGTFSLNSLPLTVTYAFAPATKQITFEFQAITATYVSSVEDPYLRIAFGDKSLGEMLAFLLALGRPGQQAKLSPPWNVLNAINLNGLLIEIHFKTRELRVLYRIAGGKDLGFLRLDAIGLTYKRLYGEPEVEIIIEGRLLGQEYTEKNPLAWNATDGAPPATPGAGASVLDLRYLGIGQHVSLRDVGSLQTVGDVINALREAAPAISDESANPLAQLGSLGFDPDSGWLIGADFTVIKTLTLSIVFNDPKVYGLLIELAGDKAGSFAGLKFEILYRKVTDTVGVYRIELKLPTVMRTFTTGNFSLTLPVVVVEIYTNGDFRIDMGFPPSLTDFSRSFNIQYFPFIGYGGFYFAKLSGATSTTVPKIDDGTFNPVIEFGIALSVGLGKTLSLGILSGGISVTVTGMVQGTYAFYEPYDSSRGSANFFLLQGTIGVLGQVYATVDFSVVKADVNLTVYAAVSLTVEVYQPALIEVVAGVRVKVKIKIVFVRVSFSFNATIREKFVIGKPSTPPWHVVGDGGRSARRRLSQRPLARHRPAHRTLPEVARAFPVTRLKALTLGTAAVGPPVEITLFVTPAVTKASIADLAVPDTPLSEAAAATDVPAISLQLFVETALPTEATGPGDARLVVGDAAEKGFSKLAGRIFGWALSDIGQAVDTVTAAELGDIEAALKDPANIEKYFSYAHIADFLSANARFTLAPRPVSGTPVSMAFFPMIPVLALKAGSYAFDFGSDRIVTPEYEKFVDRYFDDLAVDYANSVERNPDGTARTMAEPAPVEETVATLVFRKYFQLLTRAVVQAAIDELRTYKHSVTDAEGASLASIAAGFLPGQVAYVVRAGDTLGSIAADFDVSEVAIEDANPGVDFGDLKPGEMLAIPVTVTTARIVEANQAATGILYAWDETELASGPRAGAIRQRPVLGGIRYSIQAADTLDEIAKRFGIGAPDLAAGNADQGGLFAPGARISAGDLSVATRDGDTLASLARYYVVTEEALLDANTDPAIALAAGRELVVETADGAVRYTVKPGDTVGGIADAEGSSTAAILRLNADIRVAAGQQIVVQGAGLLLAEAVVVHYAVATGDTEDTILATYFGAATPELRQMLAAWNPEVDLATLAAGTILEFPYTPTFTNLARYFGIDAAALVAANAAVSGLLAQRAVLVVPPITPEIRATDSFASLADRYALGLAELGELLAATPGLFRDPNADEGPVVLTIANVPAFTISALTERLVSAGAFNEVAASVSRFLLHGLRLPHVEDDSAAAILSRPDRQAADSAAITTFPVFAMIGQEFEAPGTDTKDFAIDLSKTHLADWVALATGDTLSVPLSPEEMQQIAEFAAQTLDPQVRASRRLALIEYQPRRTPLSLRLAWAAGALPADTCLSDPDRAAGEPTIWPLPTALIDAVAASRGQAAPYGLVKGHTRPDGRLSTTSLTCGFFATTVEIEIARVPVEGGDAPFLPDTYTIRGADDAGKHRLLETLLHLRETSGETAQIYPLYGADPVASDANSDGLVSDAFDRTASAVLKTNLSTLSHGTAPSPAFAARRMSRSADPVATANFTAEQSDGVLELLWEASTVRSGGFYLTYRQGDGGLPGRIFGEDNTATLTLLVILGSQAAGNDLYLYAFNTVALVGESIDLAQQGLFAQPLVHRMVAGDTLTSVAADYPALGLTTAALAVANAAIRGILSPGATLTLPDGGSHTVAPGDTLSGIAAAAGTTVEALAGANETAPVFVTDTLMQFRAGDLEGAATVPPGTSGIYLERDNPEYMNPDADRALGAGDAATELSTLYNLLSFRLSDTADFAGSGEGLPAGPTNEDARASNDPGADTDAAADPDEDRYWRYRRAARISLLAKHNPVPASPALPDARQNPYAGIRAGATVSFSLALQDIYGNRVTPATALQPVTAPVGYTDPLIAPGRWPGSTGAYRFAGDAAAPRLVLDWAFDPSRYTPMPGQAPGAAKASARVDLEQYIRIYYQVAMPGTRFALGTTLGAVDPLDAALRLDFAGFAYQAYAFLGAVAAASPVAVSQGSAPNDTLDGIARAQSTTPGEILAANPDARADALFAAGQSLRIPKLVVALPDDTLEAMAVRAGMDISGLAAAIAEHSPNARLGAGTVINAAERPYQVPPDPFLTAATIAADEAVSLTGLQGADTAPLVPGLIEANTGALLEGGAVLTLNGVSLAVAAGGETLAAFVTRFQDREPSATAVDLVVANRMLAGLFAPEQELGLPNYVVAGGDTLAGVAEALAPRAGGIVALLTANATVPAFFPTAEALVVGFDEVAIPSGRSVHEIAEDYGSSLETLGAANGALALAGGASVVLPYRLRVAGEAPSFYRAASAMRFADVVVAYPGWSMPALGDLNAGLAGLFNPETAITLAGTTVTPTLEDSFQSLAAAFDLTLDAFANAVAGLDALVRPGAVIAAPAIESADAETLGNAAARIGTDPGTLGATNAALYGLLQPGQDAVLGTDIVVIGAGATLGTVADALNVLRLQRGQAASVDAATVARANTGLRLMATTLFPPVRPLQIGTAVTPAYQTAIWPVKATLTMTRPIDLVDPEFADVEQVFSIETALAPQPLADTPEDALAGPDAVDPATPRSLKVFADVFEGVFPGLKLATGNDRATRGDPARWACGQSDTAEGGIRTAEREAGKDTEARQLWAVNLGTQGPPSARFGFTVNGAATACYALPPLSTDLWQATDVDLPKFVPGRGIEGTVTLSFSGVDIDAWAGRFYAMLDRLLSPAYAAAIHRLDGATLAGLVGVKGRIASALKRRVAPIIEAPDALDDPATATDEAAEALYQQLLTELSAAYTVDAIVQVPFDVTSSCSNPATAARLSGKPIGRSVTLTEGAAASLDALATELDVAPAYLAEMVSAQRFVLGDGITLGFDSARFETTRSTTIGDVAVAFGVTPADLPGRLEVVTPDATLFRVGATLTLVALSHMLAEGDSFAGIAGGLDITVEQLVAANAKRTGVFQTGSTLFVPSGSGTVTVEAGDTLADLGTRLGFGTLQAFADALWAGDIEDANRYTLQPDTTLRVLRITPVYSFTTGKVALSNGRQRATFLLDVKDLAANRALLLDLDYTVTELEYDIVERQETVGDYQDSSWLSFVIPLASTPSAALPNDSRVGQVAIPLPLRAYPGLATVSRQTADGLEDANKAALFDWTYGLEMRRQTAAQDAMTLDVRYNVGAADALVSRRALAESPELARALAAFSVAEAALEADLPALGDPAAASGAQAAAKAALGAFATFADAIAAAFEVPAAFLAGSEDGDAYLYDLEPVVSDERRDSFGYLMLRSVSGKPDFVLAAPESMTAALVAALDARTVPPELRSLFADAGFPLSGSPRVVAETPGSAWRIVDTETVETYALFLDPADQASRVVATRRYLWPQLFDTSSGGEPAPLERRQIGDALLIPYDRPVSTAIALSFGFEQLDLVTKQNGWSGIGVTRNARLLPKRTTNPDFVYRTREAMFPSKVTPYVLRSERVDLRDFASGTGTDPSLTEALSGFFNALFRQVINAASVTALDMGAAGAGRFVKVAARYGYDIAVPAGGAAPFGAYFPLVLVPEYRFEIPGDAMPDAGSFVTRFAKAVEDARAAAGAPAETGLFQIEVTVYSTDDRGTDTPVAGQPILSLTNLVYALPAGAPRP